MRIITCRTCRHKVVQYNQVWRYVLNKFHLMNIALISSYNFLRYRCFLLYILKGSLHIPQDVGPDTVIRNGCWNCWEYTWLCGGGDPSKNNSNKSKGGIAVTWPVTKVIRARNNMIFLMMSNDQCYECQGWFSRQDINETYMNTVHILLPYLNHQCYSELCYCHQSEPAL